MMTKQRAIRIIVNDAKLYKENLENQKILFLYGIPSEVKKQIIQGEKLSAIKSYEVAFSIKQNSPRMHTMCIGRLLSQLHIGTQSGASPS